MKSTFHHLVRTHYRYIMMARVVIFGDWTASFHLGWHAKGKLDEPLLLCSENHVIYVYHRSPVLCIAAPLGHVSTLRDQCTLQSNPCFYFNHRCWACGAIKFRLLQCHFLNWISNTWCEMLWSNFADCAKIHFATFSNCYECEVMMQLWFIVDVVLKFTSTNWMKCYRKPGKIIWSGHNIDIALVPGGLLIRPFYWKHILSKSLVYSL